MNPDTNAMKRISATWPVARAICACEHDGDGQNSRHEADPVTGEAGHGKCKVRGCKCRRFTWKEWTRQFLIAISKVRAS
jgi:hypothetical protein